MIEVFAGGAVFTSVAKHYGLGGIGIKLKKARRTCRIYQLDLLQQPDRDFSKNDFAHGPHVCCGAFLHRCGPGKLVRCHGVESKFGPTFAVSSISSTRSS